MYGAAKRLCAAYRVKPAISIARRFLVDGKATTEGTTDFVKSSGLQLFHTFAKSNLLLTPIIHGKYHKRPACYMIANIVARIILMDVYSAR